MDLRQLEILRAIAESGSFTGAGERLHVSQSAISRQVLLLEEELGETVFHRIGRRIRITAAGEALLQLSHRVFQDIGDTVSGISDKQERVRGTLRLVGGMTVCLYVFPRLLAELASTHPSLDLQITAGGAGRSIDMLRSGEADLGLVTLPVQAADLVSVPLFEEELILVTYPSHPLASSPTVTPAQLHGQPFILFEAASVTRRLVEDFFVRERIELKTVMETENVEIIKAMVRAGLGISVIPWQAAAADVAIETLRHSHIHGHSLVRQTGWVYPKVNRLPRAVEEVLRVFEEARPRLEAAARSPRLSSASE